MMMMMRMKKREREKSRLKTALCINNNNYSKNNKGGTTFFNFLIFILKAETAPNYAHATSRDPRPLQSKEIKQKQKVQQDYHEIIFCLIFNV